MHVLLTPIGSLGDVLPLVAFGSELQKRGHEVTLIANGYFRTLAEQEELGFVETAAKQTYLDWVNNPATATTSGAIRLGCQVMVRYMPVVYSAIRELYVPGETVVAAPGFAFGARIANEKLDIPLATIHLQPAAIDSIYDEPRFPKWLPRYGQRWISHWVDNWFDKRVGPQINAFRADLRLPAFRYPTRGWSISPQVILGFFPDWFAAPQPDWPSNVRLVGFPRYDAAPAEDDSDEVEKFLSEGEPPIVFSHSSSIAYADSFFATSVEIARRLRCRAILLTPYPRHVPRQLPPGVRHFTYLPFGRLLPRAAAHVHPGGIGTIAQTLAAGIPQMIVPMVNDQPDNSLRLQRLGVSIHVRHGVYRPRFASRRLRQLIDSRETADSCRTYAQICQKTNALESACSELEGISKLPVPAS